MREKATIFSIPYSMLRHRHKQVSSAFTSRGRLKHNVSNAIDSAALVSVGRQSNQQDTRVLDARISVMPGQILLLLQSSGDCGSSLKPKYFAVATFERREHRQ